MVCIDICYIFKKLLLKKTFQLEHYVWLCIGAGELVDEHTLCFIYIILSTNQNDSTNHNVHSNCKTFAL